VAEEVVEEIAVAEAVGEVAQLEAEADELEVVAAVEDIPGAIDGDAREGA
jgi:hypothetical protein